MPVVGLMGGGSILLATPKFATGYFVLVPCSQQLGGTGYWLTEPSVQATGGPGSGAATILPAQPPSLP